MKTMLVLSMGALLLAGTLSAQTPVPEWQAGVDKVKTFDSVQSRTSFRGGWGVAEREE